MASKTNGNKPGLHQIRPSDLGASGKPKSSPNTVNGMTKPSDHRKLPSGVEVYGLGKGADFDLPQGTADTWFDVTELGSVSTSKYTDLFVALKNLLKVAGKMKKGKPGDGTVNTVKVGTRVNHEITRSDYAAAMKGYSITVPTYDREVTVNGKTERVPSEGEGQTTIKHDGNTEPSQKEMNSQQEITAKMKANEVKKVPTSVKIKFTVNGKTVSRDAMAVITKHPTKNGTARSTIEYVLK